MVGYGWGGPTLGVTPGCLSRVQEVKLQPPKVVPMEMRTVCRVPGLVEALQRFRGGCHSIPGGRGAGAGEPSWPGLVQKKCPSQGLW